MVLTCFVLQNQQKKKGFWTSDFGKWGQNRPQNLVHEKGHTNRHTNGHRDSMKESAKGRFFENISDHRERTENSSIGPLQGENECCI